jgi:hypothetical protein
MHGDEDEQAEQNAGELDRARTIVSHGLEQPGADRRFFNQSGVRSVAKSVRHAPIGGKKNRYR